MYLTLQYRLDAIQPDNQVLMNIRQRLNLTEREWETFRHAPIRHLNQELLHAIAEQACVSYEYLVGDTSIKTPYGENPYTSEFAEPAKYTSPEALKQIAQDTTLAVGLQLGVGYNIDKKPGSDGYTAYYQVAQLLHEQIRKEVKTLMLEAINDPQSDMHRPTSEKETPHERTTGIRRDDRYPHLPNYNHSNAR